jgi:undecaprenyl-diphosphatase
LDPIDRGLESLFNGLAGHNALFDSLAKFAATDLVFFVLPAVLLLWFWPSPSRATRQRYVGAIVVCGVIALAIGVVAGSLRTESRPFVGDTSVVRLIPHGADNSFPSDHTLLAFSVSWVILWWKRVAGLAALALATLVALGRVIVGVHWPIDVVGSAVIALVAAGIAVYTVPLWAYPQRVAAGLLPDWIVADPDGEASAPAA